MFRYNNTHIFTGYLKQLLSSVNIPTCKIYTCEFARYLEKNGKEDPRVLVSFDTFDTSNAHPPVRINYLKNNELCNYFLDSNSEKPTWRRTSESFYDSTKTIKGLTRILNSPGNSYDNVTHEYLGEYLRFLRDYHDINLMSLYNCFSDKIYNNIYFDFDANKFREGGGESHTVTFSSQDTSYRIYAVPVKLFAEYTIAVDCSQGIEMFCGLYNTSLDMSTKAVGLAAQTYKKVGKTLFSQPFLYDKLNVKYWPLEITNNTEIFTRCDIVNREKDFRLFIKVPVSCKSSIAILEGDYRSFNDFKYKPMDYNLSTDTLWLYQQNHYALNFDAQKMADDTRINLNTSGFKPISRLQLLAFNTGESFPFADRLVEYLSGSAITPIDELPDNIKRAQRVMKQNNNYFKIEGLWENKMQKLIYDYMINSGPITVNKGALVDAHRGNNPIQHGYHPRLGHNSKSMLYDVLGYVDKDAEKWYASWKKDNGKAQVKNNIQNIDIYDGIYNID